MRTAIIGAGIAGLAAARKLVQNGGQVVVYDREPAPGGRLMTARKDGFAWDMGATSIAPFGRALGNVIRNLDATGLIKLEKRIDLQEGLRVTVGDPRRGGIRIAYEGGMDTLTTLLAVGIDVQCGVLIDDIERSGNGYKVNGEAFDAVLITVPLPQVPALLWSLGETRPITTVQFRPCVSVGVGYKIPLPETRYHALMNPDQSHPLTWLSLETAKSPSRAPDGGSALVAQLSRDFSLEQSGREDVWLVGVVAGFVSRLFGAEFQSPDSWTIKRWKYAQPESLGRFDLVNRPGQRCVIAGDGLSRGRVEEAFDSGERAALHLLRC